MEIETESQVQCPEVMGVGWGTWRVGCSAWLLILFSCSQRLPLAENLIFVIWNHISQYSALFPLECEMFSGGIYQLPCSDTWQQAESIFILATVIFVSSSRSHSITVQCQIHQSRGDHARHARDCCYDATTQQRQQGRQQDIAENKFTTFSSLAAQTLFTIDATLCCWRLRYQFSRLSHVWECLENCCKCFVFKTFSQLISQSNKQQVKIDCSKRVIPHGNFQFCDLSSE